MTFGSDDTPGSDDAHHVTFARCSRCAMKLRRSEMDIHLAHSHDIGPKLEKDKRKDRRSGSRAR